MDTIIYPSRYHFIPPEITRIIITHVVAEYLDAEIWQSLESRDTENPIPAILQASLQIRNISLSVLSDALGIDIVEEGGIKS
jgi:hypothetical protein